MFDPQVPRVKAGVTVVREDAGFWYVSGGDEPLAPCADPDWAVGRISAQLIPRIGEALEHQGTF
ncbi:hypothetical protein AGRA3207_004345 [Actinomadura graeca]|uniref:Uncharacterized protein n=1 Tax=Actinomadura graeca TaxID=2750812 RepID=A0ABX8QY00_9ACTN|nr:hypothetical protein [Actinomadura graeca]QXJ23216.1 hypothetical protein AGRA3207_004345 [Actinomadura graeca]